MNILKITSYYPEYFNSLNNQKNNLKKLNYNQHLKLLMSDHFGWSDSISYYLKKNHNFEANEVIYNYKSLQNKWIKNILKDSNSNLTFSEILKKQIEFYNPDIVFAHSYNVIDVVYEYLQTRKKKYYIIGYDGIGLNNFNIYQNCNAVVSCLSASAEYYNKNSKKSLYLPHGFDKRILDKLDKKSLKNEIVFTGGINNLLHIKRVNFLYKISKEININLFLGINNNYRNLFVSFSKYLNNKDGITFFDFLKYLYFKKYLYKNDMGALYGIGMFNVLQNHLISLNNHINSAQEIANMRVFETTGVGTLLFTDNKNNSSQFFENDKEIITYVNFNDAIDKLNYLLKNKNVIESIARAGSKKNIRKT